MHRRVDAARAIGGPHVGLSFHALLSFVPGGRRGAAQCLMSGGRGARKSAPSVAPRAPGWIGATGAFFHEEAGLGRPRTPQTGARTKNSALCAYSRPDPSSKCQSRSETPSGSPSGPWAAPWRPPDPLRWVRPGGSSSGSLSEVDSSYKQLRRDIFRDSQRGKLRSKFESASVRLAFLAMHILIA